jgi:hypothetical protein
MSQPPLGDFFALDADTIRTAYIKAKAARLAGDFGRVVFHEAYSTKATKMFTVWGDTGTYTVWLRTKLPAPLPWMAACSRGGVHDNQPDGEACSHGLAAAVAYELSREAVEA